VATKSSQQPEQLVAREAFWIDKLGNDARWQLADSPPPRKRNWCGYCAKTIEVGERCLSVGMGTAHDGTPLPWDRLMLGGPFGPRLICEACSQVLVKRNGSPSDADIEREHQLDVLVNNELMRMGGHSERRIAGEPKDRKPLNQWSVLIVFLIFEFVVAAIVKGSHAQGSGAILLYMIPVVGALIYLAHHELL
jgi:hypothetical protein